MEIVSWQFALFSLIVLAGYYLLSRPAQNVWLLAASYFFYSTWGLSYAGILLGSTLVNFLIARRISSSQDRRKTWLALGIGINLLGLFLFRLAGSLIGPALFSPLLPASLAADPQAVQATLTRFFLPVGFSFYTLQAISYLIDVSRKQLTASSSLASFALYMAYFPRLTAGPIERAKPFLTRLAEPRTVDNAAISRGLALVTEGLVRKVAIADTLSRLLPPAVFSDPTQYNAFTLAISALVYTFVLYNDFAGYTAIVRGLSIWFGIELSPNFQQPYLARGFAEFWNRWHLSFSYWLRDYIFFPLTRWLIRRYPRPSHPFNVVIPPMAAMLASGLWHGFNPGMILWGTLHGLYQALERLAGINRPRIPVHQLPRWRQLISMLFTFMWVSLAWIPFAAGSQPAVWGYLRGLIMGAGGESAPFSPGLTFLLIAISTGLDWVQYHTRDETVYLRWVRPAQAALLAFAILLVAFSSGRGIDVSGFVYQGF